MHDTPQYVPFIVVDPHIHIAIKNCTAVHVGIAIMTAQGTKLYDCYTYADGPVADCHADTALADAVMLSQGMVNYCLRQYGARIL
jgi:hypothetical protein